MIQITSDNFTEEVERSERPVLVDFWGPSCQPCLALMPVVEEMADRYKEELRVAKIDSSKNRRLCINLKVMSLPTFLLYHNGREIGRLTGNEASKEGLRRFLAAKLNQEDQ